MESPLLYQMKTTSNQRRKTNKKPTSEVHAMNTPSALLSPSVYIILITELLY